MQSYEKQIWHCPNLSEFVRICQFLSVFGTMLFLLQSYEKENWHCQSMSVCVSLCHFMSLSDLLPLSRCKVTKRKFGTVTFCHYLSPFVTFCHLSANCFFLLQSYEKEIWHCPAMSICVHLCPATIWQCLIPFSLQSYEIEIWHCPNLSNYVQICPFNFVAISLSP